MMKKGIIRIAISSVLVIIMLMQCFPVLALSGADVLSADSSALIKFNIEDVSGKPDDTVENKKFHEYSYSWSEFWQKGCLEYRYK